MKKLITLLLSAFMSFPVYSQEKVTLKRALKIYDMLEVSLEIENKPNDNFHLVKIDTLTVIDGKKQSLNHNIFQNKFRKANVLARYEIDENKPYRSLEIKGVINYFKPSKDDGSYFDLGKIKDLQKNTNLISKSVISKNPDLFFGIVDAATIDKVFPNFEYRNSETDEPKKIDFKSFDLIYALKADKNRDFAVAVNGDLEPGFNTLTLTDKKTRMVYKLVKLQQNMTLVERESIRIELMIENEAAVRKIPFDFKNVQPKG